MNFRRRILGGEEERGVHVPCRIWFNGTNDGYMHIRRKRERELVTDSAGGWEGNNKILGQRKATMARMVRMARMVVGSCLLPLLLLVVPPKWCCCCCVRSFLIGFRVPTQGKQGVLMKVGEGETREFIRVTMITSFVSRNNNG